MLTDKIIVRIDFPALADLVSYLRDSQQIKLDALTEEVGKLTQRLKQSSDGLNQAEVRNQT